MLKNRTWFTDNTEVLTNFGWVDITKLGKIHELIVLDLKTNLLKAGHIVQYNKAKINNTPVYWYRRKDIFICAKEIHFPKDCIWRVDDCVEIPKLKKKYEYSGYIYNIITKSNTLITRNHTYNSLNNNDYIVSLCQSVK